MDLKDEVLNNLKSVLGEASDAKIVRLAAGRLEIFVSPSTAEVVIDEAENYQSKRLLGFDEYFYSLSRVGVVSFIDSDIYELPIDELETTEVLAMAGQIRAKILQEDLEEAVKITLETFEADQHNEGLEDKAYPQ